MNETNNDKGAVLLTGASRGLGRNMAKHLSARGFHVFAGCRKPADASGLVDETPQRLTPLLLDVTDEASVAAAVETVSRAVGEAGLTGLINNAGTAVFGPVEQVPLDTVEEQLRVNILGPIAVTQKFLPLLRLGRGRLVNISSVNGFLSIPYAGIYSASKFALEALSDALRVELKPWGISVSVVQPGIYETDIRARSVESWAVRRDALSEEERMLYESGFEQTRRLYASIDQRAADPQEVSEVVVEALTAESPKTRYLVGEAAQEVAGLLSLSDEARDEAFLQMYDQAS